MAPDFIQIHHIPDQAYLEDVARTIPTPLIGAISVREHSDIERALAWEHLAAHWLFDAATAGSGLPFDWSLLQGVQLKKPWFLAGGLNEHTVAKALRVTRAPMVDVSSGIESAPGIKSAEMIAAFNRAVLAI